MGLTVLRGDHNFHLISNFCQILMVVTVTKELITTLLVNPTSRIYMETIGLPVNVSRVIEMLNQIPSVIYVEEFITPTDSNNRHVFSGLIKKDFCEHKSQICILISNGAIVYLVVIFWRNVSSSSND